VDYHVSASSSRFWLLVVFVLGLVCWMVLVFLPLLVLLGTTIFAPVALQYSEELLDQMLRSFGLAGLVAASAVVLGYIPGSLLGTCSGKSDLLLLLMIMPLVLPRYLLYYAWSLLLSPTTQLGRYLAGRAELAEMVGTFTCCLVLVLWYWPLAALLIAQGWRKLERQVWDSAALEAGPFAVFFRITLPLLAGPILLAFAVSFVLCLSEFATFHLAGIPTIGTELSVIYQRTGSETAVFTAALPLACAALAVAIVLARVRRSWEEPNIVIDNVHFKPSRWRRALFSFLLVISLFLPLGLLVTAADDIKPFVEFFRLHGDELAWSSTIALGASMIAFLIALAAFLRKEDFLVGQNSAGGVNKKASFVDMFSFFVSVTIFLVMFLPASVHAVSLLKILSICGFARGLRESWFIVSAGQGSRFAGLVLILLTLAHLCRQKQLAEMASLDGASRFTALCYIHLPQVLPLFAGAFILVVMLSLTEISATMVLLPAGLPNFAQRLINQMHYAREQQVIASCLVLTFTFLVLAGVFVMLMRIVRWNRLVVLMVCIVCLAGMVGCRNEEASTTSPRVLGVFGRTGGGQGEFIYPRAIDIASDGTLFIADKTGRIQHISARGEFLGVIEMPLTKAGKPTGITVGPDGNLYVADTHYHRVVVFSEEGKLLKTFGSFGEGPGCFIYPTDIAFSDGGRIFVSEYGGNDRISVFNDKAEFLYSFGSPGSERGQFARPSALCIDNRRRRLYVADACNNRIAVYDLRGRLQGYIGSVGRAQGQLRYPYDLALLADGTLVVCEYGNNRLQLFSPDGTSIAVYGEAGRELGQLAYPWGVAVDSARRAFVVDAGNDRIQIWQL